VGIENFWVKKEFDEDTPELCRFGLSTAEVTNTTFLIYGGVNPSSNVVSDPLLYDVVGQMIISLEERGESLLFI